MVPPSPLPLSAQIAALAISAEQRSVTLAEVVATLHGSSYLFFVALLALPFCSPIPLFGLSTPFGLAISLIGLRLMVGEKPLLPKKLMHREIPPGHFAKVLSGVSKLLARMERVLRIQMTFLTDSWVLHRLYGFIILTCGLLLMLPLPIPFTNGFPAWTILMVSLGWAARDGLFTLVGLISYVATLLFFVILSMGGLEIMHRALDWLAK